jgi:cytochrome c biogenesis protein CcdA/thiol-disulfide isomerase/thioredoxin
VSFLFVVAVIGGAASVLTPCVLPLLPAILVISRDGSRARSWGIAAGIELSFFLLAILLASVITALGLPPNLLRWIAAGLLTFFGLVLIVPKLDELFANVTSKLTSRIPQGRVQRSGFVGGVLSGLPLGLVWAPCAGPILAGITIASSSSRFTSRIWVTMLGYAIGMFLPLSAVIFGGQRLGQWLRRILGGGRRVLAPMGVILLATAVLVGVGGLERVNRFIAERIDLTSTPTAELERRALTDRRPTDDASGVTREQLSLNGYPETDGFEDLGPAPEFAGISRWYNSEPLAMRELRDKVVLVDFWTYSCINCIRTFPHLRRWHDTYADDGLVIVGVHTPEFEFEKDPGNVGRAVKDFDISYPVALDPDLRTWNAFYNHYWPAHYLIDKDGTIRSVHFGEGEYAETEREIRELLGMSEGDIDTRDEPFTPRTPETYLGWLRAERYQGRDILRTGLVHDREETYAVPRNSSGRVELEPDTWSYDGTWKVGSQGAVAGRDAKIFIRFRASKVHIVAGPATDATPERSGAATRGSIRTDVYEGGRDVVVDEYKLYTVRDGDDANAILELDVSPGVEVFAFTFG